jgi:hypothetical protein
MNRFQEATAGVKSGVESAMDNIRSEYEQAMWGRQTTSGEAEIFTTPAPEPDMDLGDDIER